MTIFYFLSLRTSLIPPSLWQTRFLLALPNPSHRIEQFAGSNPHTCKKAKHQMLLFWSKDFLQLITVNPTTSTNLSAASQSQCLEQGS